MACITLNAIGQKAPNLRDSLGRMQGLWYGEAKDPKTGKVYPAMLANYKDNRLDGYCETYTKIIKSLRIKVREFSDVN